MNKDLKKLEEPLDYDAFIALHKVMAKKASKTQVLRNNMHQWLLYVQCFSEFLWLQEYKGLSPEDLIDFGILKEYKFALKNITIGSVATSLIYCAANLTFVDPKIAIMQDAFNFALTEIYEKYYKDTKVSSALVYKLRWKGLEVGQKIINLVPCDVIDMRLTAIASSYPNFAKDEIKYIKESLTTDLDSSVVIDLKKLHSDYMKIQTDV